MQSDRCPHKKGTFALRHTGHVMREAEMGPRQGTPGAPRSWGRKAPPTQPYEEACPPWPQNRQRICFCLFKAPSLWPFVTRSPRRLVHWPFPQCLLGETDSQGASFFPEMGRKLPGAWWGLGA